MADTLRFKLTIRSAKRGAKDPEIEKVQEYLTRFGYLTTTASMGRLDNGTSKALRTYQQCFGLKATGDLTQETIGALESKRCGNPDVAMLEARAIGGGPGSTSLSTKFLSHLHRNTSARLLNSPGAFY